MKQQASFCLVYALVCCKNLVHDTKHPLCLQILSITGITCQLSIINIKFKVPVFQESIIFNNHLIIIRVMA